MQEMQDFIMILHSPFSIFHFLLAGLVQDMQDFELKKLVECKKQLLFTISYNQWDISYKYFADFFFVYGFICIFATSKPRC